MKQNLLLLFPIGTLKIQGILNWETQIAPKRERVLGKVKVKVEASIIPSYVGGVKEKYHMTKHNMGCRTVTSSKNVKKNIGKNRQLIMMKQLLVLLPSSYSTLKLLVKQKAYRLSFVRFRMVSGES